MSLDAGKQIEESAKWVGEQLKEGAKIVGEAAGAVVEIVAKPVVEVVKAIDTNAGKAIEEGTKWVGEKIKEGAETAVETVVDTVENGIDTVKGGFKAVDKLLHGDLNDALNAIKETPLYKSGEELVENIKEIDEGIVDGDLEKIGKGAFGVLTNDITSMIPVGKVIGTVEKVAEKGVKKVATKGFKKAEHGIKTKVTNFKDDIAEKGFKKKGKPKNKKDHPHPDNQKKNKNDKKDKKDKKDKNDKKNEKDKQQKQCKVKEKKGRRIKRGVTRLSRPKTQRNRKRPGSKPEKKSKPRKEKEIVCDEPDKCKTPDAKPDSKDVYYRDIAEKCQNSEADKVCHYLCHPGYDEKPHSLVCKNHGDNDKRWDKDIECEPHNCEHHSLIHATSIKVEASRWGSDIYIANRRGPDALLYYVLFDERKKLPIYSMTYHNFPIHVKIATRAEKFMEHPCTRLGHNQATNNDYKNKLPHENNPHGRFLELRFVLVKLNFILKNFFRISPWAFNARKFIPMECQGR